MSTLVELVGFAAFVTAAFLWQSTTLETITGLCALGVVLLLVGYALDDAAAVVAFRRVIKPVVAWRARRASSKAKPASQVG